MKRLNQLRKSMKEKNIEALLITSPYNLRYISHFTGTTGLSIITMNKAYFVTDFRYTEQAREQAEGFEIVQRWNSRSFWWKSFLGFGYLSERRK